MICGFKMINFIKNMYDKSEIVEDELLNFLSLYATLSCAIKYCEQIGFEQDFSFGAIIDIMDSKIESLTDNFEQLSISITELKNKYKNKSNSI